MVTLLALLALPFLAWSALRGNEEDSDLAVATLALAGIGAAGIVAVVIL
ncbi:MAG: hypothetical protein ACSLFM_10340 [Tepidiformaceae bacterium]